MDTKTAQMAPMRLIAVWSLLKLKRKLLYAAKCNVEEFACLRSQRCIPRSWHCNGIKDECGDGSNDDEAGCDCEK